MNSDFTTAIKQEVALTNLGDQILDRDKATHNRAQRLSSNTTFPEAANASRARSEVRVPDDLRLTKDFHRHSLAALMLFATWYQRACFRAELLDDLRHRPEYLSDIGICRHEARSETTRFFWEPVLLRLQLAGHDH